MILLTGGNGFLGKHVKEKFKQNNIDYLAPNSKVLDLTSYSNTLDYFDKFRPTTILHMAAVCGGILANKNSPADFILLNSQMTVNLFSVINKFNIRSLYSLGTVCMYPKFCPTPFTEETLLNGPPEETNKPYGDAKRHLLSMFQAHKMQYALKGAHFLPVNMYGPFDNFDPTTSHVIPALIRKFVDAKRNNHAYVECWGSGNATREFFFVEDCAEALAQAVKVNFDYSEPINLGTGESISIKNLAGLIAKLVDFSGDIVFNTSYPDGQPSRQLDVSKAKYLLDFEAKTNLLTGLVKTIDFYKTH